jgi:hypothetical protein
MERLLAPLALGRPLEHLERLPEAAVHGGREEELLRAEEAEEVRLRDPRPAGDVLRGGALEPPLGELDEGGVEDVVAALGGGEAGRSQERDSK